MDNLSEKELKEHIKRTYKTIDENKDNEFDYKYALESIKLAQESLKNNFGWTDQGLQMFGLMEPKPIGGKRTKRHRKTKRRVKSTRRYRHKKSSTRHRHRR